MALPEGPARDLLIAILVVGGILLALFLYTGNWPPPVVVESNSMMHVDPNEYATGNAAYHSNPEKDWGTSRADGVPFGRIGTIDPGDLVLVKEIDGPEDVDTFADASSSHYGRLGEVVVYFKGPGERGTPIIHRAMTYVDVDHDDRGNVLSYTVRWSESWEERGERCEDQAGRYVCIFDSSGIRIPEIGWHSKRTFNWSGFVTQGDNVVGNPQPDQVMGIYPHLVKPEWVKGVARGELPWFGLIKLVFTGNPGSTHDVRDHPYYDSIGQMTAPRDLWVMLLVGLVVVGLAPVGIDYGIHRVRTHLDGSNDDGANGSSPPETSQPPDPPDGSEEPAEGASAPEPRGSDPEPGETGSDPELEDDEDRIDLDLE